MDLWELKKGQDQPSTHMKIFTGHTKKDDWPDEQMSMLDITNKKLWKFPFTGQQFNQGQGMVCSTIKNQRVCNYDLKEESCIDQQK